MRPVEELFGPNATPYEPPLSNATLADIQAELGVALPAAYVELCRIHNGGYLRIGAFPMRAPTSWADDHVGVNGILAIGRTVDDSLCGGLGQRLWIEEWGYPEIGVYFADCPSAGHDMLALDYRSSGEPAVVHVDQGLDYRITPVAPSFAAFIDGLRDEMSFGA